MYIYVIHSHIYIILIINTFFLHYRSLIEKYGLKYPKTIKSLHLSPFFHKFFEEKPAFFLSEIIIASSVFIFFAFSCYRYH
jgi:hypothetical protein